MDPIATARYGMLAAAQRFEALTDLATPGDGDLAGYEGEPAQADLFEPSPPPAP